MENLLINVAWFAEKVTQQNRSTIIAFHQMLKSKINGFKKSGLHDVRRIGK